MSGLAMKKQHGSPPGGLVRAESDLASTFTDVKVGNLFRDNTLGVPGMPGIRDPTRIPGGGGGDLMRANS